MARADAEAAISAAELGEFASAIAARFGHQPDERRNDTLRAVLGGRMRQTGARGFAEYKGLLAGASSASAEWAALAPLLTVPETYFYRMPEHFDALVEEALPRLFAERRKAGIAERGLRMLSAGCATGEEAYTLRMVLTERLRERLPAAAGWRIAIEGVDLSAAALERAREGVYSEWSLRATDALRRRRWFQAAGKQFRLNAEARAGVSFRQENLLVAPEGGELYDVIFCRNVLIYFTDAAMRQAIAGLSARLAVGGYLFLGPAESLRGLTREFQVCHARETFFYRRKEVTEAARAPALEAGESWYEGHSQLFRTAGDAGGGGRPQAGGRCGRAGPGHVCAVGGQGAVRGRVGRCWTRPPRAGRTAADEEQTSLPAGQHADQPGALRSGGSGVPPAAARTMN